MVEHLESDNVCAVRLSTVLSAELLIPLAVCELTF